MFLVAAPLARAAPPPAADFWRNVVEPHADEVELILRNARNALQQADGARLGDYDPTGEGRARLYRDLYGMLRYAHRLAPDNVDVLRLLGQTADELGQTREAIAALTRAVELVGADRAGPELAGRLGAIYLRLGKLDDAIHYLRLAQGPITSGVPMTAEVLVHLSNALALRGEMTDAIDVLANSLPAMLPYYSNEQTLVSFALAVQYDRDEQLGAAFDVIDHMQSTMQAQLGAQIQNALAVMRYAPAEDQHYYLGLLYEITGNYTEARAEWALYAASGDLPYRARALEHVAAIDALPRATPPAPGRTP